MDKGAVFHKRYLFAHQAYCSERWPWRPDEWKSYLERGVSGWPVFSFAFSRTCLNRSVIWLDWQKSQGPYATELNPFTCPLALKQVLQQTSPRLKSVPEALVRRCRDSDSPLTASLIYIWLRSPLQPGSLRRYQWSPRVTAYKYTEAPAQSEGKHLQAFRKLCSPKKQHVNRTQNLIQCVLELQSKCNAAY